MPKDEILAKIAWVLCSFINRDTLGSTASISRLTPYTVVLCLRMAMKVVFGFIIPDYAEQLLLVFTFITRCEDHFYKHCLIYR